MKTLLIWVADILCAQVQGRLKRNLSFGHSVTSRDLNRVRGRINVLDTYSRQLLMKGKVSCTFEELTVDTPRNRYVSAALAALSSLVRSQKIRLECVRLVRVLTGLGVGVERETKYHPKYDRLGRHESEDRRMLVTAQLAFDLVMINEESGGNHYCAAAKQEQWLRALFEKAVGGFYQLKLDASWSVKTGSNLDWQTKQPSANAIALMPKMKLDIALENKKLGARLIIDTKFTSITKENQYGADRFKSGHIYQLYTYIRSQEEENSELSITSSGMLLYPSIGVEYDENVDIQGHTLRFCTVDLSKSPQEIAERLLAIVPS
jgi:5-methylcytosine-specific restriction enzyme subunit McrC